MRVRGYRRRDGERIPDSSYDQFKYLRLRAKKYTRMYREQETKERPERR